MGRPKKEEKHYATTVINGDTYYRTRIRLADGSRYTVTGKTEEEVSRKVKELSRQIDEENFRRENPTVAEYCKYWLDLYSANVRVTTMNDYRSVMKKYVIETIGEYYMAEITENILKELVLAKATKQARTIYDKVNFLVKKMFTSAVDNDIIPYSPATKLPAKGGKSPKEKTSLSDDQVEALVSAIRDFPPYPFVMLGIYAGLRREEALALQWDCVFLDEKAPYIAVKRAWHIEHNRPVISTDLKTKAAKRNIPIPVQLVECLRETKAKSIGDFVVGNQQDGGPLSGTQWARLWKYVTVRTTKPRTYTRYLENGEKVKHTVTPQLGEQAAHNSTCVYSLDFVPTPHQLRHTFITKMILSGANPKRVQYLAGHENIKITMDIYTHLLDNRPEDLIDDVNAAFAPVGKSSGAKSEQPEEAE